MCLGGSSTNDGGAGLLAGLGAQFLIGNQLVRVSPETLSLVTHFSCPSVDTVELIALSDVNNPLLGEFGASAIFGPQKGVTPELFATAEAAVKHFADLAESALGQAGCRDKPGSGAAGGLGFALQLLGAKLQSGAATIADLIGLDTALAEADWVITGEGRSDTQTALGKAPWLVAQRALAQGVPCSLLSGGIDIPALPILNTAFTAGCHSLCVGPISLAQAIVQGEQLIEAAASQLAYAFTARGNRPAKPSL
jgi:glycerate 2-kinase